MKNNPFRTLLFLIILLFCGCSNNSRDVLLHHMDYIKQSGDANPKQALHELSTIEVDVKNSKSDYANNKYLLLKARLRDKAFIEATASDTIEAVVAYFDEHGSAEEKMEAYYYMGSVYRDMKDNPRSIMAFNTALDIAKDNNIEPCALLQNTYSQLSSLYIKELLYAEALSTAKAGYEIAKATNSLDPTTLMDVATAAINVKDTAESRNYCVQTFEAIRQDTAVQYPDVVCELLMKFSLWNMKKEEEECMRIIQSCPEAKKAHNYLPAMVSHYECLNMKDSSLVYTTRILSESPQNGLKLSASYKLMDYYIKQGDYAKGSEYALLYARYEDSVFTEKQYEQTSRACGEHLYTISLRNEMKAKEKANTYKLRVYFVVALLLALTLMAYIFYIQKKQRFLKIVLEKERNLEEARLSIKQYNAQLEEERKKLCDLQSEMQEVEDEMQNRMVEKENTIKQQHANIAALNETIAQNEAILLEKQKQIKDLVRLTLLEKASIDSADILQKFQDAACGKKHLTDSDWNKLYTAVEAMYPGFREAVMSMPHNSESCRKTAYLLKIGFSNPQIVALTEGARTTVWERVKKAKDHLGALLNDKMM